MMINNAKKLYKKVVNKETILYSFFGILTSVENIVLFKLLLHIYAVNLTTINVNKFAG